MLVRGRPAPGVEVESRILKAEMIPFDAADFERVGRRLFGEPGGGGSAPQREWDADDALKAPWLTPGERVAGLERFTYSYGEVPTPSGRWIRESELSYGDDLVGPRSLTVYQNLQQDVPYLWSHIPPGFMSIQAGQRSDGHRSYRSWTGALVRDGVYVRIETGAGEQALFDVVRALRPAS